MELKLNITMGQTITVLILVIIAFFGGAMTIQTNQQQVNECPEYNGFTKEDINLLSNLAYTQGFCERLGLQSNIIINDINGIPYGIPICVEPINNGG